MVSSATESRSRKSAGERRDEIVAQAAEIALEHGLESITLRAVAERLGVRPGLITHYFPAAQDLVIAAFVRAVAGERELLIPLDGTPVERMARMVYRAESPESWDLARLWLNARHLSRFKPALAAALLEQEALDRDRLVDVIEAGNASGDFSAPDPLGACVRILVAIDGAGAYVNTPDMFADDAYTHFVSDTAEWALGLQPGTLRAAVAALPAP